MKRVCITWINIVLIISVFNFMSGCATTNEGAQTISDIVFGGAGIAVGAVVAEATHSTSAGVAAGGAVFALSRVAGASSLFKSKQLKFQNAVLKGSVKNAQKYADARFINKPIKGYPPVYYAVAAGDSNMLIALVRLGASVKGRYNGRSLAYTAASFGRTDTAYDVVKLGGGTQADVAQGRVQYIAARRQQELRQRQMAAAALLFVGAMMQAEMNRQASEPEQKTGGYFQDDYSKPHGDGTYEKQYVPY